MQVLLFSPGEKCLPSKEEAYPLSHRWHKGFLCCWSTEFMPAYASAGTKNSSHFFLTSAAHLSFHTSLSQVTMGQSKCLCIRTNGWGQQESNRISLANSAGNIAVATSSVSPLPLCCAEQSPGVAQSWGYKWCLYSSGFPVPSPMNRKRGQVQASESLFIQTPCNQKV